MRDVLFICLLFLCGNLVAQDNPLLLKNISIQKQEASIENWFKEIEKQGITVSYNPSEIELDKKVKVTSSHLTLGELMSLLLGTRRFRIQVADKKIIIIKIPLRVTLSGFVREEGSNEALIGATLRFAGTGKGAVSNLYGFYSITLPEGKYLLEVSYMGYGVKSYNLELTENLNLNINLQSEEKLLSEVEVTAPAENRVNEGSMHHINLQETDKQPQFLGVDDALKRIKQLPGVGGGTTGIGELKVRGGNADQNLILLDGVPMYNYNHFTGLLSVFNNDALKHVNFYKGTFPARFNGRLSSVVDIRMREGDMEKFHAGSSIDVATVSAFAEGPLIKGKSSFLISARRSWIDMITLFDRDNILPNFSLHDINVKANYKVDTRNHLYFSLYSGADTFWDSYSSGEDKKTLSWGNGVMALRWNHLFSDKLFSNTSLSMSRFDNSIANDTVSTTREIKTMEKTLEYKLMELTLNSDFEYYGELYNLRLGSRIIYNRFRRPQFAPASTLHWMAYFENKLNLFKNMDATVGLNYNLYSSGTDVFLRFQPRILLNYSLHANQSFFAGFSEMSQFFHQLSINTLSLPYEFRMPSSGRFIPGSSRLYELGYRGQFDNNRHEISASVFLNHQYNIVRYRLQQNVWNDLLAPELENQILSGNKKGKGFELSYRVTVNPLEFNSSYTFSDIREQFKEIDNGDYYPAENHSRHVVKSNLSWHVWANHYLSVSFSFNSGQYITVPLYEITTIDNATGIERQQWESEESIVLSKRNSYRVSSNYQVDLGYTFLKKISKKRQHVFRAGIYNIAGKSAPFSVSAEKSGDGYKILETTMPHFMPYLSYSFKF